MRERLSRMDDHMVNQHSLREEDVLVYNCPSSPDEPGKPQDKRQPGSAELFFLDRDLTAFADDDLECI